MYGLRGMYYVANGKGFQGSRMSEEEEGVGWEMEVLDVKVLRTSYSSEWKLAGQTIRLSLLQSKGRYY